MDKEEEEEEEEEREAGVCEGRSRMKERVRESKQ